MRDFVSLNIQIAIGNQSAIRTGMPFRLTLRMRIYFSMLAIVLLTFLVTGGVAIYDHREQTDAYNGQRLHRKEDAVKQSMTYFLEQQGGFISTDSVPIVFTDKICELGDVHNLVITLFDLRGGYLISSAGIKLDSLGVPDRIDYTILKQLATGNQRAVLDRKFGNEEYTQAYWYFVDATGKPIAITNVLYDKTDNDRKDLWAFLSELGGSYIILFIIAAVVAYLLSRYITRSLKAIGERMKQVQLGRHNQPLEGTKDDEIGTLVTEYNRMLDALEESAAKLARTERESAWRDMAQQVAHEIKNPLTPMKLRVQHLERAWQDGAPDFDQKLRTFTKSMSEQIESLSHIAGEFSQFAKLPKPELVNLDLGELAKTVTGLYQDNGQAEVIYRNYAMNAPHVLADKDQARRAIVNLITNALQALPEGREGKIDVALRDCRKGVMMRIQDNGEGIAEAEKDKIFVPNFTTKTTGLGLGLAMVMNIMKQSRGEVFFRSKNKKGASFYLVFPLSV
ncbi:MAG: HAMP domain-containing sensor histidine kinase [Flavobacteriales bacterium]|nr:HAMP domain-containing sensor histidine kinase [Flavobacteriales bacterium]